MRGREGTDILLLRFGETHGDRILGFSRADGDRLTVLADVAVTVTAQGQSAFLISDGHATETITVKGAAATDFVL